MQEVSSPPLPQAQPKATSPLRVDVAISAGSFSAAENDTGARVHYNPPNHHSDVTNLSTPASTVRLLIVGTFVTVALINVQKETK